jgi:TFIIF-interacting CTD phosphatase-like protein
VAVFTAGYDWYANPIIDRLDPTGTLFQHRFFRQHCNNIRSKNQNLFVKDLALFKNLDLTKVLFVDNALFSFACNLKNGIPMVDFIGQQDDTELLKVSKYVKSLA